MPDSDPLDSIGAWAKKYHLTARALVESVLREHDLGPTQWSVLQRLVEAGPTMQRDLGAVLRIERATLSGVVTTLVRKGLVLQTPDVADQRQRLLSITDRGRTLWSDLPDPLALAHRIAFETAAEGDVAVALRVLQEATRRLADYLDRAE